MDDLLLGPGRGAVPPNIQYNAGDAMMWHKHYSWGHSKTYMLTFIVSGLSQVSRHSMPLKIVHCG